MQWNARPFDVGEAIQVHELWVATIAIPPWNVKGPNFIALHELFDHVAEELLEHADDLSR